jgi:hypothetical protein
MLVRGLCGHLTSPTGSSVQLPLQSARHRRCFLPAHVTLASRFPFRQRPSIGPPAFATPRRCLLDSHCGPHREAGGKTLSEDGPPVARATSSTSSTLHAGRSEVLCDRCTLMPIPDNVTSGIRGNPLSLRPLTCVVRPFTCAETRRPAMPSVTLTPAAIVRNRAAAAGSQWHRGCSACARRRRPAPPRRPGAVCRSAARSPCWHRNNSARRCR